MKKMSIYTLLLAVFTGMTVSCSPAKTDAKQLEGKWNVVEVNGMKLQEETLPQMDFNLAENQLHGNGGCNIFNTTVVLDPDDVSAISINPAAATMMACPNMETEDALFKAMHDVKAVKAGQAADEMWLVDASGNALLVLSKK